MFGVLQDRRVPEQQPAGPALEDRDPALVVERDEVRAPGVPGGHRDREAEDQDDRQQEAGEATHGPGRGVLLAPLGPLARRAPARAVAPSGTASRDRSGADAGGAPGATGASGGAVSGVGFAAVAGGGAPASAAAQRDRCRDGDLGPTDGGAGANGRRRRPRRR